MFLFQNGRTETCSDGWVRSYIEGFSLVHLIAMVTKMMAKNSMEGPEGAKMFYFVLSVKGFWLMQS